MPAPLSVQLYSLGARAGDRPRRHDRTARRARLRSRSSPSSATGASEQMREFAKHLGADAPPARHRRRRAEARARRPRDGRAVEPRATPRRRARGARSSTSRSCSAARRSSPLRSSTPSRARSRRSTISTASSSSPSASTEPPSSRAAAACASATTTTSGSSAPTSTAAPGLEVFYELCEPDVVAEVDVYWAQLGGR